MPATLSMTKSWIICHSSLPQSVKGIPVQKKSQRLFTDTHALLLCYQHPPAVFKQMETELTPVSMALNPFQKGSGASLFLR